MEPSRDPSAIIIREATPEDAMAIAHVHIDGWRAAYRGVIPDETLAELSYEQRAAMWREILTNQEDQGFTYIAVPAGGTGEAIGFISGNAIPGWDPEFQGEIGSLYIREAWQRHGLGQKFIAAAARWLIDRAQNSMLVWSVAANIPARAFYERLGGRVSRAHQVMIGGELIPGVAYGWADLQTLAGLLLASSAQAKGHVA